MKRREFFTKAGLGAVALPFAINGLISNEIVANVIKETPSEDFNIEGTLTGRLSGERPRRIMGVDQVAPYDGYNLVYKYRLGHGRWGDGLATWDRLSSLMRMHQIELCVIDCYPETSQAIKFQNKFPGSVVLCQYVSALTTSKLHMDKDAMTVMASRKHWYASASPSLYQKGHQGTYANIAEELLRRYL